MTMGPMNPPYISAPTLLTDPAAWSQQMPPQMLMQPPPPMMMLGDPGGVPPMYQPSRGTMFGRMQVRLTRNSLNARLQLSLFYSPLERQLVVTILQAADMSTRPDGQPRNPYVKMFLLPDRRLVVYSI